MVEPIESPTGIITQPEAHTQFDRFMSVSSEELIAKKSQIANFLNAGEETDENPRNASDMLRYAMRREYENVAVELHIRNKGQEEQRTYRQAYHEGDILAKREMEYAEWAKQMQGKYGDNWEEKVPGEEWYQWREYTSEEQAAYQKRLKIKDEAGVLSDEERKGLPKLKKADRAFFTDLRRELRKAFPDLTDEQFKKVTAAPEFLIFDFFEDLKQIGALTKGLVKTLLNSEYRGGTMDNFFREQVERGVRVINGVILRLDIKRELPQQGQQTHDVPNAENPNNKTRGILTTLKAKLTRPLQAPPARGRMPGRKIAA